jgi:hypothetical protein
MMACCADTCLNQVRKRGKKFTKVISEIKNSTLFFKEIQPLLQVTFQTFLGSFCATDLDSDRIHPDLDNPNCGRH